MDNELFLVTCAGMSASKWLAASLDRHPDVFCTHSSAQTRIYDRDYTGEELRRLHINYVRKVHFKLTLKDFLDELENKGDAPVHGNVHGYRLNHFIEGVDMGGGREYRLANLVRHPYAWADSCAAHFVHMSRHSARVRYILLNSYYEYEGSNEPLVEEYGLDILEWTVLGFFHATNILYKLAAELRAFPEVRHVRMEAVTRDADAFAALVKHLTGGNVEITDEYLGAVFSQGAINAHTGQGDVDEAERYANWPAWKRQAFDARAAECGIIELYKPLGYTF